MVPGDRVLIDDGELVVFFDKRRSNQIRLRFVGKSHKVRLCRLSKQGKDVSHGKEKSDEKD